MAPKLHGESLYAQVVAATAEYMGPAANRFIVRQIRTHLSKDPAQLEPKDLPILAHWIKLEISLLTDEEKIVDAFARSIEKLSTTR
jgi:hypothetical protein